MSIAPWFNENKVCPKEVKMEQHSDLWIYKRNVSMFTECSDKNANRHGQMEDEQLVQRAKLQLLKDPNLYALLANKADKRKSIFALLSAEVEGADVTMFLPQDVKSNSHLSESYFRRSGVIWDNVTGTPGFEGSVNPTFENVHKLQKVLKIS